MPITKDTPKYAAILLAADGSTELIFAADDKSRATSEGLAEYVAEKEDTESQVGQPDYVEPAWDLYVRERDVYRLANAVRAFMNSESESDEEIAVALMQEALDRL